MAGGWWYDNDDLDLFRAVLDDMMDEIPAERASPEDLRLRRIRFASAILCCANRGERDRARLKALATRLACGPARAATVAYVRPRGAAAAH